MTVQDVLRKYMDSASMIIRVYKAEDYGNENTAEPIYPMGYLWELPQLMCLGEYQNLMNTEIKGFNSNYNVAIHFYI